MKNKYFILTLCASALLAACSNGSSNSNTPNQSQKKQNQMQNEPAPKTPDNAGKTQDNPTLKAPDNAEKTQNTPMPKAPDNAEKTQDNPTPKAPDNAGKANESIPNIPDNSEKIQNEPEAIPSQPTPPLKYTGEYVNKYTSSATWNGDKDVIIVYEVTPTKESELGYTNVKNFTSKEIRLTLAQAQENGKNYKFLPLDEVGYYGYRQAIQPDGKERYNDYIYAVNEKLIANNVPTGLNATYNRPNGFIFGPATPATDASNAIKYISDVNIVFNNGNANGSIKQNDELQFKITGNTKSLVFESNNVNLIKNGSKAIMEPKFINSSEGANDLRYITGVVKGDDWAGVLAAEKK